MYVHTIRYTEQQQEDNKTNITEAFIHGSVALF